MPIPGTTLIIISSPDVINRGPEQRTDLNVPRKLFNVTELSEVLLPAGDALLSQFSLRQVWTMVDTDDDRLSSAYWLSPPNMHDLVDNHDAGQVIFLPYYFNKYIWSTIHICMVTG